MVALLLLLALPSINASLLVARVRFPSEDLSPLDPLLVPRGR